MECYSQEQLLEFSENESPLSAAISSHLQDCAACRREVELFQKSWDVLGEWQAPEPSYTLKAQVWEKIRLTPAARPSWIQRAFSVMSLVTAACICVTFLSNSLSMSSNTAVAVKTAPAPAVAVVPDEVKSASEIPSDSVLVLDEDSDEFKLTATVNFEDKDSLGEFSHDLLDEVESDMQQSGTSEL
jgi:hypothetical protein